MAEAVHPSRQLHRAWPTLQVSPAIAHAIRCGVALSAALWLGHAPGLITNSSSWIAITVLVVLQPTAGSSILKGLMRIVGTVAAAFTAILLFGLFGQNPSLMMAAFFLVALIGAYGYSGPRFQYAWYVWAFTTAIILSTAIAGQAAAVETVAFQRASMVAIGIFLVLMVESLLWPTHAEPQLRQSLAARARELGAQLKRAITLPLEPEGDAGSAPASGPGSLTSQLTLADAARSELGVEPASVDALTRIAVLLEAISSVVRALWVVPGGRAALDEQDRACASSLTAFSQQVEAACGRVANAVVAHDTSARFAKGLDEALLAFEVERNRRIERVDWSAELAARASHLRHLVSALRTVEETLSSKGASAQTSQADSWLHFRLDPLRVKTALRAGFATTAAIVMVLVLDWPMNGVVAVFAFSTATLTRGAATQTVAALVIFVLLGWGVGDFILVYLTPHAGRMPHALVINFIIASTAAYVGVKIPKLAGAYVFIGMLALLSAFAGPAPPTDVYGPYSTATYLFLAIGVGWIFSVLMWPATSAGLFRQRVALQLEQCLEAVRGTPTSSEKEHVQRATELIQGCTAQMAQLGRLNGQASHERVERALDPPRRTRILSLAMDLMDAVATYHLGALEPRLDRVGEAFRPLLAAVRREDEALVDSMQSAVSALRGEGTHRASGLAETHQAARECVDALRADPRSLSRLSDEETRHIIMQLESRRALVYRQLAIEEWLEDWQGAEASRA
jgi:uncharacterized membrane protein YccC